MRRMYDAAYPPSNPPHWDAAAGYIGGDTPHVWTAAEWARQPVRYRLPIFVRSNPTGVLARAMSRMRVHPVTGGTARTAAKALARLRSRTYTVTAASDAVKAIAWLRANHAPKGCTVSLDLETAINAPYVRTFNADLLAAGYKVLAYGSLSTIFHNPKPSAGYWVAHYTGSPHMESGAVATQWTSGSSHDSNLVADSVPLWDTKAPTPTPTPAPPPEEDSWFQATSR